MANTSLIENFFYFRALGNTATNSLALAKRDLDRDVRHYASSPWSAKRFPAASKSSTEKGVWHLNDDLVARIVCENTGESNGRKSHNGWYTSPYQEVMRDGTGLCRGVVVALPHGRFYPGYQFGGTEGGPTVDFSTAYDDADDAKNPAESMAEYAAEHERDYQTAWAAGNRWADEKEELEGARLALKELLSERRKVKGTTGYPAICKAVTGNVMALLESIKEARRNMTTLKEGDYRDLIFYPDERLTAAFNEGAAR